MKTLGVDIGGTSIKIGLVDENKKLISFQEYPSFAKEGAEKLIERVINSINSFTEFGAIGISTAGQVNREDGSILYANENIPGYTGIALKKRIGDYFKVPVKVENDVNAAALGEKYFGNGQQYQDFLCITYGTGIGGSIVLNGSIYEGTNGLAGEFGHIITHPGGKRCNCGNLGCYEMYASTTALVHKAHQLNLNYNNGRSIFLGLQKQDKAIFNVVKNWVYEVAVGLTSLIHIFNPPAIIVGGGIMEQESIINLLRETLKKLTMNSFSDVKLVPARLGNQAGIMGAAALHLYDV